MDLLYEENYINVASEYNPRTIYEWNIDGQSDYQIFQTLQNILMFSTISKANGNTEPQIAQIITGGFSGQLKGRWDNYLTP